MKTIHTYIHTLSRIAYAATISISLGACNRSSYWMGKGDDIAEEAKSLRKDHTEEYAENVAKTSKYENEEGVKVHFPAGKPKCNLFVFDVLNGASATAPLKTDGKWPFLSNDWKETSHSDFDLLDKSTTMQAGDIIATEKHCGIAVDKTYVIAAGTKKITLDTREKQKLTEGSVRRYNKS